MSTRPEAEAAPAHTSGPPRSGEQPGRTRHQGWLGAAAVFAVLVCCAGPALLASGALAVVGGIFHSPVVIAGGAVAAAVAVGWVWLRRRRAGPPTAARLWSRVASGPGAPDASPLSYSPVRELGHSSFVSLEDPDGVQIELWLTITVAPPRPPAVGETSGRRPGVAAEGTACWPDRTVAQVTSLALSAGRHLGLAGVSCRAPAGRLPASCMPTQIAPVPGGRNQQHQDARVASRE